MIIVIIFPKIYKKGLKNVNRKQKPQGGGGLNCSNQSNSTSSRAKFFAPLSLISSVLAIALCASGTPITGANTPSLTITNGSNGISASGNSWSTDYSSNNRKDTITWQLNNDIYSITASNTDTTDLINNDPAKNLALTFNNSSSITQNSIEVWSKNNNGTNETVAAIRGEPSATSIVMDFGNKGLTVDGVFGLLLNFGTGRMSSSNKTIEVRNLSTLKGNLTIYGGEEKNKFDVTIGSMTGNIRFDNGNIDDDTG